VPRSTDYRHRQRDAVPAEQRPTPGKRGPQGPCDDEALVRHIRGVRADSPFHGTGERVGLHAARRGTHFEALEPLRQVVREHFGAFGPGVASGLAIRHDQGSADFSGEFQRELAFLGMTSAPSSVREPEGNGCAERFIRTLKENLLWVRAFATVAELVAALGEFKWQDNAQGLIGRDGHRTPSQVRHAEPSKELRTRHARGSRPSWTSGRGGATPAPTPMRPGDPRTLPIARRSASRANTG
jgi:hypothetical protein